MTSLELPTFGRGLFEFLGELKINNNRTWFNANKQRYIVEVEYRLFTDITQRHYSNDI